MAKQSQRTSQHPTTTDEAEQSQRASSAVQRLSPTVEVEQGLRTSSVSQPRAATAEESLVSPKIATAAETEQSQRTSLVA